MVIKRLALLLAAALLSACAGGTRLPEDSFYRLEIGAPAQRMETPALAGILSVQTGATAPVYRDRAFLYSDARMPGRLQRYHYHYWMDAPPRLVQRSLADYLRAAGIATAVVTPEDAIDVRYRLRVDIERFEQHRDRDGGDVSVELSLTLSEPGSGTLLLQERLHAEAAVQGGDHPALAAAYRRAMEDLYARILTRLRDHPVCAGSARE
jgi:cholesterol transport system auxiliary component